MAIPDYNLNIPDNSFVTLDYVVEPFNNSDDVARWVTLGYTTKFTGAMCDMRNTQPKWTCELVKFFTNNLGWKNVGTSFYRMDTGTVLPVHSDTYKKYIELYDLHGREPDICRAIVFLEDWHSGHYLEIGNTPVVGWKQGDVFLWEYDAPHMAANQGKNLGRVLSEETKAKIRASNKATWNRKQAEKRETIK